MFCLAGTTWAWFTATLSTPPQQIAAASYSVSASATDEAGAAADLTRPLPAGQVYTVTLTADGTAQNGGYCIVLVNAATAYTTESILPGGRLTFTLIPETDALYTFTGQWGANPGNPDITNGAVIGTKQAENPEPADPAVDAGTPAESASSPAPAPSEPASSAAESAPAESAPAEPASSAESVASEESLPQEPAESAPASDEAAGQTSEPAGEDGEPVSKQ